MFFHMSVHYPKPGKQAPLVESMHRFRAAIIGKRGCVDGRVLRSLDDGRLVGLAIWQTRADWEDARPAMNDAVKDDPFEEWEEKDPEVFHLEEV